MNMEMWAIFNLDNVLIRNNLMSRIVDNCKFKIDIKKIKHDLSKNKISRQGYISMIADKLSGSHVDDFSNLLSGLEVADYLDSMIFQLKKNNILTAIINESYDFLLEAFAREHSIDKVVGIPMIIENGYVTGKMSQDINHYYLSPLLWKESVIKRLFRKKQPNWISAVGCSDLDACMLQTADLGISVKGTPLARGCANINIDKHDLPWITDLIISTAPKIKLNLESIELTN